MNGLTEYIQQLQTINRSFDNDDLIIGITEEGYLENRIKFDTEFEYVGIPIAIELIQDWLYSNVSPEVLLNDPMIFNEFFIRTDELTFNITEVWGVVPGFDEVVVLIY